MTDFHGCLCQSAALATGGNDKKKLVIPDRVSEERAERVGNPCGKVDDERGRTKNAAGPRLLRRKVMRRDCVPSRPPLACRLRPFARASGVRRSKSQIVGFSLPSATTPHPPRVGRLGASPASPNLRREIGCSLTKPPGLSSSPPLPAFQQPVFLPRASSRPCGRSRWRFRRGGWSGSPGRSG